MRYLLILLLFCSACNEKIVSEISESKTNQILIALSRYGVEARKVRDGNAWSIEVAKNDSPKALEILSLGRFLAIEPPAEESSGFVQSKAELERSLERKLSRSLEETLGRLPRVLEARVHLSSAEGSEFAKDKAEKTASVLMVVEPGHSLSSAKVQKIVSGASGLKTESVLVVSVYAQQPEKLPELITAVGKNHVDINILLASIPILASCLVAVRRFELINKKTEQAKKLIKLELSNE